MQQALLSAGFVVEDPDAAAMSHAHDVSCMRRVLVVDDDQTSRMMLSHLLLDEGFAVVEAVDGVEAVYRARQAHFDAVLMDIHMPVMDGCQAAETLRSDTRTRTIPIVACTALGEHYDEWQHLFVDVIRKPFTSKEVITALRKHIGHSLSP